LKSNFTTISQEWSPYWDNVSRATFGLLPWRPRSQHDLASKSCLAQNFVIWSQILQLFLTNYFSVSNTYSGSIIRFRPALVCFVLYTIGNWRCYSKVVFYMCFVYFEVKVWYEMSCCKKISCFCLMLTLFRCPW